MEKNDPQRYDDKNNNNNILFLLIFPYSEAERFMCFTRARLCCLHCLSGAYWVR